MTGFTLGQSGDDMSAYDVTDGIEDQILADLEDDEKSVVMTLLARVSERAYRRGFQQGVVIGPSLPREWKDGLHNWRYAMSTDVSPAGDHPHLRTSAIERLHVENRNLPRLGLWGGRGK